MSPAPIFCVRFRDGEPASSKTTDVLRVLCRGATRVDLASDAVLIEWTEGLAEVTISSTEGVSDELTGFAVDRFTCFTAIDRVFDVADAFDMMIFWERPIVTKDHLVERYRPFALHKDETVTVVRSSRELVRNLDPAAMNGLSGSDETV